MEWPEAQEAVGLQIGIISHIWLQCEFRLHQNAQFVCVHCWCSSWFIKLHRQDRKYDETGSFLNSFFCSFRVMGYCPEKIYLHIFNGLGWKDLRSKSTLGLPNIVLHIWPQNKLRLLWKSSMCVLLLLVCIVIYWNGSTRYKM